jgi:hypothetical protein
MSVAYSGLFYTGVFGTEDGGGLAIMSVGHQVSGHFVLVAISYCTTLSRPIILLLGHFF